MRLPHQRLELSIGVEKGQQDLEESQRRQHHLEHSHLRLFGCCRFEPSALMLVPYRRSQNTPSRSGACVGTGKQIRTVEREAREKLSNTWETRCVWRVEIFYFVDNGKNAASSHNRFRPVYYSSTKLKPFLVMMLGASRPRLKNQPNPNDGCGHTRRTHASAMVS